MPHAESLRKGLRTNHLEVKVRSPLTPPCLIVLTPLLLYSCTTVEIGGGERQGEREWEFGEKGKGKGSLCNLTTFSSP